MADKKVTRRRVISEDIDSVVSEILNPQPQSPPPSVEAKPTKAKKKAAPAETTPPRKQRKDATGRKSDYHKSTVTLAVRLSAAEAEQVRAMATATGLSVNAWLIEAIQLALNQEI